MRALLPLLSLLLAMPASASPLLIAHRGASAQRPEHTIAAYRLAIEQGADFIEPDLVLTKDGVLVARHDVLLAEVELDDAGQPVRDADGRPVLDERTTDVADHPEFAARMTVREVDGEPTAGWFVDDFTLAELRTLRARERMPELRPDNEAWTEEPVATFAEVLALRGSHAAVGIYPELKHPTYFMTRGQDIVTAFLAELEAAGGVPVDRIFVQCFEIEPLRRMKKLKPELRLIQLFGSIEPTESRFGNPWDVRHHAAAGDDLDAIYGDLSKYLLQDDLGADTTWGSLAIPMAMGWMSETYSEEGYAAGFGLWIPDAMPRDAEGRPTGDVPDVVKITRDLGVELHVYTLRPEAKYRPATADGGEVSFEEELKMLIGLGVDGVFTDEIARARAALTPK